MSRVTEKSHFSFNRRWVVESSQIVINTLVNARAGFQNMSQLKLFSIKSRPNSILSILEILGMRQKILPENIVQCN